MRTRHSPDFLARSVAMDSLDVEDNNRRSDSLVMDEQERPRKTPATSQRIHAVRPEVINALSFLSVVLSLYKEQEGSLLKSFFVLTGISILLIDCYFIYCEWQLKTHHAVPFLTTRHSIEALDDLVSDLPQCVWVFLYLWNFKFSLIAMVCAVHSAFSLVEGLAKLQS